MSELELILRHRLAVVRKGVVIGTERLQEAQDARGLSNERLARELHIAEKTWRRWKAAGEVPAYYLEEVAAVLGLEIEQPKREPLRLNGGEEKTSLGGLRAELEVEIARLRSLNDALEAELELAQQARTRRGG
jgi:transcriptional regulator with XRE-family HTH domain